MQKTILFQDFSFRIDIEPLLMNVYLSVCRQLFSWVPVQVCSQIHNKTHFLVRDRSACLSQTGVTGELVLHTIHNKTNIFTF